MVKADLAKLQLAVMADINRMPRDVRDAANKCILIAGYGGTPPQDLRDVVTAWYSRQFQQNRYGK